MKDKMRIGNREFDTSGHTYIMGILNVTPDSFSDGGKWSGIDNIRRRVEQMIKEGADVIDVGGESTRPGYVQISDKEEQERVVPVIEMIKREFDIPVSIDTYKFGVAAVALEAGANMVNDIWGLKYDAIAGGISLDGTESFDVASFYPRMARIIAFTDVPCCLMHNSVDGNYVDFKTEVKEDLADSLAIAESAGIDRDKIILDPGIGFGKTYEQNLIMIRDLDDLYEFDLPILLGASRKSVIGNALKLPVDQRVEGTLATTAFAVLHGAMFVRVHDIEENCRFIKMMEAIVNG